MAAGAWNGRRRRRPRPDRARGLRCCWASTRPAVGRAGPSVLEQLDDQGRLRSGGPPARSSKECQTGEDANESEDCRIVGFVNSIQSTGPDTSSAGTSGTRGADNLFTGSWQTRCGGATSQVGPFYCPRDQQVYIDLDFFGELQSRFGAKGGPFAQAYVSRTSTATTSRTSRGAGADRGDDHGRRGRSPDRTAGGLLRGRVGSQRRRDRPDRGVTQADIKEGLYAAAAIGDDRIQERRRAGSTPKRGHTARRSSAALVPAWLSGTAARRLRHLQRLDLAGTLAFLAARWRCEAGGHSAFGAGPASIVPPAGGRRRRSRASPGGSRRRPGRRGLDRSTSVDVLISVDPSSRKERP